MKRPIFQFPYSDGVDKWISVKTRAYLLRRLESPSNFWPYLRSRCWRYCYAYLKLHPRNEFDLNNSKNIPPTRRRCLWPGIIVLCPCPRFSPEKLRRIYDELRKVKPSKDLEVGIKKHVPNWHQCAFDSPCGKLSYTLAIAVSLTEKNKLLFNFDYLVHVDRIPPYGGERRTMLYSHINALEIIRARGDRSVDSSIMICVDCHVFSSTRASEDRTEYAIQLTRKFGVPERVWKWFPCLTLVDERVADYNWTRYGRLP